MNASEGDEITVLKAEVAGEDKKIVFSINSLQEMPQKKQKTQETSKINQQLQEEITCQICIEVMHQPITVLPCLHNFCGGCLSEWFERSKECPTCHDKPNGVKKNHLLNNMIDIFLSENPSDKRPQEELKEVEQKNVFNQDKVNFDEPKPKAARLMPKNNRVCKQCHKKVENFRCQEGQNHLQCKQCQEYMPERQEFSQRCQVCETPYCNNYWKTGKRCNSGIKKVNEYNFGNIPDDSFYYNKFEQNVLKDHLKQKKVTMARLKNNLVAQLENAELDLSRTDGCITKPGLKPDSQVCEECSAALWKEFLYQYREKVHPQLPNYIKKREDCWYGRDCRTQRHNITHAQKYNHVCRKK